MIEAVPDTTTDERVARVDRLDERWCGGGVAPVMGDFEQVRAQQAPVRFQNDGLAFLFYVTGEKCGATSVTDSNDKGGVVSSQVVDI